jgi:hypothetical protein
MLGYSRVVMMSAKLKETLHEIRELLPCLDDAGLGQVWAALFMGMVLIYAKVIYIIYSLVI